MSDETVGRIEQLTQEVRRDLTLRHGHFATLSPEFERRVAEVVRSRLRNPEPYPMLIAGSDQHPPGVDHRELLRKYIAHVRDCEGIDFLDRLKGSAHSDSEQDFTAEEKAELERLASEEAG